MSSPRAPMLLTIILGEWYCRGLVYVGLWSGTIVMSLMWWKSDKIIGFDVDGQDDNFTTLFILGKTLHKLCSAILTCVYWYLKNPKPLWYFLNPSQPSLVPYYMRFKFYEILQIKRNFIIETLIFHVNNLNTLKVSFTKIVTEFRKTNHLCTLDFRFASHYNSLCLMVAM